MSLLHDLRNAALNYTNSNVTILISNFKVHTGTQLNPEEEFTFTITAKNAANPSGGIPLIDIVWYVGISNDQIGKLYVPSPGTVRKGLNNNSPILAPYTLVKEMFISPDDNDPNKSLEIGSSKSIDLKGKAGSKIQGVASSDIQFKTFASIDNKWLLPINSQSVEVSHKLIVEG